MDLFFVNLRFLLIKGGSVGVGGGVGVVVLVVWLCGCAVSDKKSIISSISPPSYITLHHTTILTNPMRSISEKRRDINMCFL